MMRRLEFYNALTLPQIACGSIGHTSINLREGKRHRV
jgi:hypothetical protein